MIGTIGQDQDNLAVIKRENGRGKRSRRGGEEGKVQRAKKVVQRRTVATKDLRRRGDSDRLAQRPDTVGRNLTPYPPLDP